MTFLSRSSSRCFYLEFNSLKLLKDVGDYSSHYYTGGFGAKKKALSLKT